MNDDSKPVIFLSTNVSGTGSMLDILRVMLGGDERLRWFHKLPKDSPVPCDPGTILFCNNPEGLRRKDFDPTAFRWLVNLRHPLDRLCNIFHWQHQHPGVNGAPPKYTKETMLAEGIDAWCLRKKENLGVYRMFFEVAGLQSNVWWATYGMLCNEDFTAKGWQWIEEARNCLKTGDLTDEQWESLTVFTNPEVHHKRNCETWEGKDSEVGRCARELKRETRMNLEEHYRPVLDLLARHERYC